MGASTRQTDQTPDWSPPTRSLLSTPSAIIDTVGSLNQPGLSAHNPKATRAGRHPVFWGLLVAAIGFSIIHALFVGGEQRGPLLPVQSTLTTADAEPVGLRSPSPPREPTVTGSMRRFEGP